ncbi:T6SS immunity protein Tli4 family protein [Stenotrophomonas pigmentata]|uniref:T6SS immunity protein Tli4 family protein n=1 Tax=Stenotrophomonas pigmentata TaxID=3055080 RepID=UPI0026EE66E4|nr:T6SS immunity protein Tli4 family protein [Stenotrophomonas sp. 610A2]
MKESIIALSMLLLGFTLSGCGEPGAKEKEVIDEFTRDMREDCLGRMVIAVPRRFQWSPFAMVTLYYGKGSDFRTVEVSVVDQNVDLGVFDHRVGERVGSIKSDISLESGASIFRGESKIREGVRLVERYQSIETTRAVTYEAHVLIDGVQVFIKGDSYPGDGDTVSSRVEKLVDQIEVAKADSGAKEGAFCLGPLLISSTQDFEVANFQTSPGRGQEGVLFEFYTSSMEKSGSGETLVSRVEEASEFLGGGMTVLRKGAVSVGGEEAEQALVRVEELEGRHSLSFGLWSMRATPSLSTPSFVLSMSTVTEISSEDMSFENTNPIAYETPRGLPSGDSPVKFDSKLTDNEAMGLWDAVVASIRPR